MQTRSPRTILAMSAALALAAAAVAPTAAFARGPGAMTQDDSNTAQSEMRGGGQGRGAEAKGRANADGGRNMEARQGGGRNAETRQGGGRANDDFGYRNQADGANAGRGRADDGSRGPENCDECDYEMGTLTDEQRSEVLFMANDEKLAHDVYVALADVYDVPVFERIAWAETQHQTAVNHIMENYEIAGSPFEMDAGAFADTEFQALYDDLVAKGSESLEAAYGVGVQIEELDIADLKSAMVGLEEAAPDVYHVFSNLLRGSERHLTSFQRGA